MERERERMYSFDIIHIVFLECKSNFSLMVVLEERSGVIRTMQPSVDHGSKCGRNYSNKFTVLHYVFIYFIKTMLIMLTDTFFMVSRNY